MKTFKDFNEWWNHGTLNYYESRIDVTKEAWDYQQKRISEIEAQLELAEEAIKWYLVDDGVGACARKYFAIKEQNNG